MKTALKRTRSYMLCDEKRLGKEFFPAKSVIFEGIRRFFTVSLYLFGVCLASLIGFWLTKMDA